MAYNPNPDFFDPGAVDFYLGGSQRFNPDYFNYRDAGYYMSTTPSGYPLPGDFTSPAAEQFALAARLDRERSYSSTVLGLGHSALASVKEGVSGAFTEATVSEVKARTAQKIRGLITKISYWFAPEV